MCDFLDKSLHGAPMFVCRFPVMMTSVLEMLDLNDVVDDSHNSRTTSDAGGLPRTEAKTSQDAVRLRRSRSRSRSTRVVPQQPLQLPKKVPALSRSSGSSERYLETVSAPTPSSDVVNAGTSSDEAALTDNDSSFLLPGSAL